MVVIETNSGVETYNEKVILKWIRLNISKDIWQIRFRFNREYSDKKKTHELRFIFDWKSFKIKDHKPQH